MAREIDPVSLLTNFQVAWSLLGSRRYDEAIAEFRKVLDMDSNYAIAHAFLGQAYERKRMYDEAIRELRTAVSLSVDAAMTTAALGHAYGVSGRRSEALKIIVQLQEQSKTTYVSPYAIAIVYVGIEDKDQAIAWLEKAYAERSRRLIGLKNNPVWDGMRSDSRFADLVRRVGLAGS